MFWEWINILSLIQLLTSNVGIGICSWFSNSIIPLVFITWRSTIRKNFPSLFLNVFIYYLNLCVWTMDYLFNSLLLFQSMHYKILQSLFRLMFIISQTESMRIPLSWLLCPDILWYFFAFWHKMVQAHIIPSVPQDWDEILPPTPDQALWFLSVEMALCSLIFK